MHYCRFSVVGDKRVANPCLFYWPLAWFLAIFYPVWGFFVVLVYSFALTNAVMKKLYAGCQFPGKECCCPIVLLLGLMFWPLYLEMLLIIVYVPSVLYAYIVPCAYASTKTDR